MIAKQLLKSWIIILYIWLLCSCTAQCMDSLDTNFDFGASIFVADISVDGENFKIHDEATKLEGNILVIERQMSIEKLGSYVAASSFLHVPEDWLHENFLNTSMLSVDHSQIIPTYLQAMAAAPFATGTLHDNVTTYNVLSIGLGAGIINGFFHSKFPNVLMTVIEKEQQMVHIATNYFGLVEDERQKVIVGDGLEVMNDSSGKYDVIFLDACYSGFEDGISCPVKTFLEDGSVQIMKKSLHQNGTLVVSALLIDNADFQREIFAPFAKEFDRCVDLTFSTITQNIVLVCGAYVPDKETLYSEMSEVSNELGFAPLGGFFSIRHDL